MIDSNIQFIIGKNAFTSLLAAVFNEKEKTKVFTDPIQMNVGALDDFIEGYSNVFDENSIIEITTQIEKVDIVSFDPTFNNVSFKADIVVLFSNPLHPHFKSAKARVAVRGSTTVKFNEKSSFIMQITLD